MRKILIVGGGHSGLQLALGLLWYEYDVTVMSARTAEEIRNGRVTSTQIMFDDALQHERDLGLNFWEDKAPRIEGPALTVPGPDGNPAMDWMGRFSSYAQSVDQRIKMAGWMETFEERGGKLVIHGVTLSDLDRLVGLYDLVLVAAGRGELVELFDRDTSRSPYSTPQRALAVVYVHGLGPYPGRPDVCAASMNMIPGIGEYYVMPGVTLTGPCDILFFEGVPGGPFDCFADVHTPAEHLRRTLELIREYVPWEYERSTAIKPTDSLATLIGRFTPTVRHPVGKLPSGGAVFGMADVVVANDPVTGQGSNNASKCAASYLQSILEHGDRPFDPDFMQHAFDSFWSRYAEYSTIFTNAMLQPPPPYVAEVLGAAAQYQEVADRFANGFNNPNDFAEWFMDPEKAQAYLAEVQARSREDGPR